MRESKQLRLHLQVHAMRPPPSVEGENHKTRTLESADSPMGCGSRDLALYVLV